MAQKIQHLAKWAITARRAMQSGAIVKSVSTLEWDVAGNGKTACSQPVFREYIGGDAIAYDIRHDRSAGSKNKRSLEIWARCRRCHGCLEQRKLFWRHRARVEIANASRTWFGTLTCTPEWQVTAQYRAAIRLGRQGIEFHKLPRDEQFAERVKEISPQITLWLKRIRKQAAVDLRQQYRTRDNCPETSGKRCNCHPLKNYTVPLKYLLVIEEHLGGGAQHGLPHFHLLIHEQDEDAPIRKRVLEAKWPMGITHFRLIPSPDEGGNKFANYVTKYLTKSILCRARASLKYG